MSSSVPLWTLRPHWWPGLHSDSSFVRFLSKDCILKKREENQAINRTNESEHDEKVGPGNEENWNVSIRINQVRLSQVRSCWIELIQSFDRAFYFCDEHTKRKQTEHTQGKGPCSHDDRLSLCSGAEWSSNLAATFLIESGDEDKHRKTFGWSHQEKPSSVSQIEIPNPTAEDTHKMEKNHLGYKIQLWFRKSILKLFGSVFYQWLAKILSIGLIVTSKRVIELQSFTQLIDIYCFQFSFF